MSDLETRLTTLERQMAELLQETEDGEVEVKAPQRYRPLAVGEVLEAGDMVGWHFRNEGESIESDVEVCVSVQGDLGKTVGDAKVTSAYRPIPETAWREPVGDAGYPYPVGTVVECMYQDIDEIDEPAFRFVVLDDKYIRVEWHCDKDRYPNGPVTISERGATHCRHRVIDYRPDLASPAERRERQTAPNPLVYPPVPPDPGRLAEAAKWLLIKAGDDGRFRKVSMSERNWLFKQLRDALGGGE